MAPAAVRLVNLDDPLAGDVRLPPARTGVQYRSLLAIPRVGGDPIGSFAIPVDDEGLVTRDQLESHLGRSLRPRGRTVVARSNGRLTVHVVRHELSGRTDRTERPPPDLSVSVIVTTCSNPAMLERCLDSILASDHDDFEVIVVENRPGSLATREMLVERFAQWPRLRYVEEPRRGLSWARNAGLAVAHGEVVAFTDDDVIVDTAWIRRAVEAFSLRDDIGCVTGLILPLELETESQVLLEQFMGLGKGFSREIFCLPESLETHPLLPYTAGAVGSGANTVLRTGLARELGGFDAALGAGTRAEGGEDLDLFIRLLGSGVAIAYEPSAIVWHTHPSGASRLRRQVYTYGVALGAMLAKQLFAGPERWRFLRAVPAGARYALDPRSRKNAGKTSRHSSRLDWLERWGVAVGPLAYLASVLGNVRVAVATRRAGPAQRFVRSAQLLTLDSGQVVDVIEAARAPSWADRAGLAGRTPARAISGHAERVVVASAATACFAAPMLVAFRAPTPLRFAAVLVALCLGPGAAAISMLGGRLEFGLVLGTSLGASVLLAGSMVWLAEWEPKPLLYGLCLVCLPPLWAGLRRGLRLASVLSPERVRSAIAAIPASVALHGALLTLVASACVASVAGTDVDRIAGLGLVNALPWTYFLALALLVFGFAAAITSDELRPTLLGAYTIALIIVLHGFTPVLYQEPRYPWVYNHLAVIDLIAKTGAVDRHVDIYNNWPGFFALNAWLQIATGLKSVTYAPWAQVFFNVANVAALRFALRGLTADERALWTAGWLFVLGNWVGQDYLAPQAFAFAVSLVILGLCLRCAPPPREPHLRVGWWWASRLDSVRRLVLRRAPVEDPVPDSPLSPRQALALGGVCYLAVVVSHQLTPVVLILGVILLALVTRRLPWWVPVAMIAVEVAWAALAWAYVGAHFKLFDLNPGAATTPTGAGTSGGLAGHALVTDAAYLAVVLIVALAAIGAVRRLRRSVWDLAAAVLVAGPVLIVQVQSYGGEARYRAYLFALPWLCFFASAALLPVRPGRGRVALRPLAIGLTTAVVGVCTLVAYFGLEYLNDVTPDDVAAAVWFDQHAPPNSLLVGVAPDVVARVTARYAIVSDPAYPASPALTDQPGFVGHALGRRQLPAIEAALRGYGVTPTFLALTESELHYARLYGLLPNAWRANLDRALRGTRSFRLIYRRGASEIFQFTPQATGPAGR